MHGLVQRVTEASVVVDGETIGQIEQGIMLLVGVLETDDAATAERLVERVLGYRIFPDEAGKMNRSLKDIQGGLLIVPQFTLTADTKKGTRPSFHPSATVDKATNLFNHFVNKARQAHEIVETGSFGADMQVQLINDGPVTFWLSS